MELPVHDPNRPPRRTAEDVRALAVAIQANLVQLRVACERRAPAGITLDVPPIPSPGAVTAFREALLPRDEFARVGEGELLLQLHVVWGQYCLMNWLVEREDPSAWVDFGTLPAGVPLKCEAPIDTKLAEVHALLWRIRFEQQRRHDPTFNKQDQFSRKEALAARIPATAGETPVGKCGDDELLAAACQHAGMLAALRWVTDARRTWNDPFLVEVAEWPF